MEYYVPIIKSHDDLITFGLFTTEHHAVEAIFEHLLKDEHILASLSSYLGDSSEDMNITSITSISMYNVDTLEKFIAEILESFDYTFDNVVEFAAKYNPEYYDYSVCSSVYKYLNVISIEKLMVRC